ncbi:unnamed protein product [Diamesa serratosioi]
MSELLSYYKLCPVNDVDGFLGIAKDADEGSIICTFGKKIIYILKLDNQKQIKSWSVSDCLSSKVIFDCTKKQYVGVFANNNIRFWDSSVEDINKIKKIKFYKRIHDIINVVVKGIPNTVVVYENGSCESLELALESRISDDQQKKEQIQQNYTIDNVHIVDGSFKTLTYVKKFKNSVSKFCFTTLDNITLKPLYVEKSIKLERLKQNVNLLGFIVVEARKRELYPSILSIWSDKRIFIQTLNLDDNALTIGNLHSILDVINPKYPIAICSITKDCIAIYAGKNSEDGSFVLLYNIKFKIVQSKVPFKVYLSNFKMWCIENNIFLALADQLSVIPFRISDDQLSSMVGSQINTGVWSLVEKEMLNEDFHYEEALQFDDNQENENEDFIFDLKINDDKATNCPKKKRNKQKIPKCSVNSQDFTQLLKSLYKAEMVVEVSRTNHVPDSSHLKMVSNVDVDELILSENFELLSLELEKYGASEVEITNKIIPILLKANRTEDIGLLLKKYNHISERMLVKTLHFLLNCPLDSSMLADTNDYKKTQSETPDKIVLSKGKSFPNTNVFLAQEVSNKKDVLSILLSCSYDSRNIVKYLRQEISLNEMLLIMDHLFYILTKRSLYDVEEKYGNLIEGVDFELETQQFEWFRLFLDSHYQQILLSKDKQLINKLNNWTDLVDEHIQSIREMSEMRQLLLSISKGTTIQINKQCNKWYKIEKLSLY